MRFKSDLYKKEQEDIMNNIINILELDNENSITLYELDNNILIIIITQWFFKIKTIGIM